MLYVILGGIYVVSFAINYVYHRNSIYKPNLVDFLHTVIPILNSITAILVCADVLSNLAGNDIKFVRKFFGKK